MTTNLRRKEFLLVQFLCAELTHMDSLLMLTHYTFSFTLNSDYRFDDIIVEHTQRARK